MVTNKHEIQYIKVMENTFIDGFVNQPLFENFEKE
jgi:hypothetical protein